MADRETDSQSNNYVYSQDGGKTEIRRTVQHLPGFYRTDSNTRFLGSTLDQLVQKGSLERLDGFIGRQDAYTRKTTDTYLPATSTDRYRYQLEPAVTYTDKDTTSINPEDQVKFTGTYDDFINQIKYFGGKVDNHDRLTKEVVYSWNPAVDLDKLVNYREYYWMPNGPNAIEIDSVGPNATVEIDVTNLAKGAYNFSNKSGVNNPILTLYRGNTYKFNIDAKGHPFWIMTEPYRSMVAQDGSTSTLYTTGVTNDGTDYGTVTFTVPTTAPDTLYYQCGNHDAMYGILQIRTITDTKKIDPENDIVGTKNYSLRTLDLSNGMKIKFKKSLVDTAYQEKEYYVEGVGEKITITDIENLITPEDYATESSVPFDTTVYDSRPYAKAFFRPEEKDYITIKRDSLDLNAWSRYNRWFHRDVIEKTAEHLGFTPNLDETDRAKRPIIEFDSGLHLYNHGSTAKKSITLFDTVTTDAFSTVVNQSGYIVDGIPLADGMRIVFSAETDATVKNKVYKVNFVHAADDSTFASATVDSTAVIALTEDTDAEAIDKESVFVELGTVNQGNTFYWDQSTTSWLTGQTKTSVNQQPLFDLFDNNHVSFSDATTYPSTDFAGAKVLEFSISDSATEDTVLGLKVKYATINNVGDIVFESDHAGGSFTYSSGNETVTKKLAQGHLHYTTSASSHNNKGPWIKRLNESKQRVIRTFIVDATEKQFFGIDFFKNSASLTDLDVSVKVNGERKTLNTDYTLVNGTTNKFVKFVNDLNVNDQVRIAGYSSATKVDSKGRYEIPNNLSTNSTNSELGTFSFGEILNHVQDILDKNQDVTGAVPGNCNLRDKPDARLKGGTIQQHQGSLLPALFGLIDQESNVISAIDFCNKEYEKFYNGFLTLGIKTAYEGSPADRVDEILLALNQGKNSTMPWYYEDMIGHGENVSVRNYTVPDPSETEYALDSQFDVSTTSNRAIYVYVNDSQLVLGSEYTFSTTDDSVNITKTLATGDKIKIKDYTDTIGSYIPPTPTKLGMYPKYTPESFTDTTYITDTTVIRRHDGSIIKAYGDERDDIILELEKRIYNNCKVTYDSTNFDFGEIMPSAFQSTDYKLSDINDIMGPDFYTWAGKNNVQYINNKTFTEGSPFTYNYGSSTDTVNNESLPGYWRGIYKYFYDTDSPHVRPWEMLGYSEKPTTWEDTYGPAPYTSGNTVLWDDVASFTGRYGKPDISNYLPVDASGNLLNPFESRLIKDYNVPGRKFGWRFGDHSPAETAWRRSSAYPFTVIKTMAITRPGKFFSTFFDNSRLTTNVANNLIDKDTGIRQTLLTAKYHLQTSTDNKTGVVTRFQTAGYQPMVVNYLTSKNLDAQTFYYDKMKNLTVQLAYKLGGFTDKNNLKILTDSISPGSTAGSKFVPDENYKILFRTSNPVESFYYSGVLIEKNTDTTVDDSTLTGGYKILGYSTVKPFFNFYYPIKTTTHKAVKVGNSAVKQYTQYTETVQTIPYGHVFDTIQDVADFLFGYGHYLYKQGFKFDNYSRQLKEVLNWSTAVSEFLFWNTQNWAPGSAISVSPGADGFRLETNNSIVGKLRNLAGDYSLLDAGGRKLDIRELSTKRVGKTFDLTVKSPDTGLYNCALNTVQKEHILLFDNKTVFSDIIYNISTGFRQARLKLVGWKTGNWNGDYYAPGFIFDSAIVTYWQANRDYEIGDTIEYQGKFYVSKFNHTSTAVFNSDNWILKIDKPAPQLLPNFDYKITQFEDFYDMESNNFDESQQNLAQRLIGYQSRDYLENLFVNDISQYKFYQGYIREKGTQNAITKLLKAKYEGQDIDLDLYPEWMIRTGDIGNVDSKESIQLTLNESEITRNPQSIELLNSVNDDKDYRLSVGIAQTDLYDKPTEYTATSTFHRYDYTKANLDRDQIQVFKTAGYPQESQVQHTAFSITDLFNIDVNLLDHNDLVWIANKSNTDWDVLRFTFGGIRIESIKSINDASQLQIRFTSSHGLSAGTSTTQADYFAIRNAEETTLNKVHQVSSIVDHATVIVDFEGSLAFLPTLEDESTANSFGDFYKFVSVRLSTMDNVNDNIPYSEYKDKITSIGKEGDKIFVDNDSSGLWKVYEKVDPYTENLQLSPDTTTADQDFGYQIVSRNDGRALIVSAPTDGQGNVHFLFRSASGNTFNIQSSATMDNNDDNTSKLGYSLSMSSDENFVVAGAPFTNSIGTDGSTRFDDSGLIKTYVWNASAQSYSLLSTITPPTDAASQNFGWAHKIVEPGADSVRNTPTKYMFVSAPGFTPTTEASDTEAGRVYMFEWGIGVDGSTYDSWTQCAEIDSPDADIGKRFGHRLQASDDGNILAISSVSAGTAGKVEIFVRTSQSNDDSVQHSFNHVQTLTGVSSDGSTLNTKFGESLTMSKDGTTLIIGAPGYDDSSQADAGAIYYYKWDADNDSTLLYTLQQTLKAPDTQVNMQFGSSVDINDQGTRLVIGAEKFSNSREMLFDSGGTTFDLQDTAIVDSNIGSGGAYTATLYNTKFVVDDRLVTTSVSSNDDFGRGVCITDNSVYVGAPDDDGHIASDGSTKISNDGTVSIFDLSTNDSYSWKQIAVETVLIDITKLGHTFQYSKGSKEIIDYYDLYDPVKGRILGIADREINIKTAWDPAKYNVGENANNKIAWAENHLGEVWWDLSKVKWLWYEQGTQEYKINHWGKTFPGSSIDVYEWIESTLLPSEYANTALQNPQIGTPLYADDSQYTVEQRYSSERDIFVNYYYFWVKGKSTLPATSVVTRKNSVSFISNLIENPIAFGLKYFAPTDTNKLLLYNTANLNKDDIVANIDVRTNNFEGDAHSIWKLVREGDKDFRPGTQVESQWWNSLIGMNTSGDKVPDVDLPVNQRYGNKMRPRQSWYVNRFDALKEIIDYSNSVLKKNQLAGTINLDNLNSADPEPTSASLEWDASVDTYAELTYINTADISGTVRYLVKADENANGFWAIYTWDGTEWSRTKLQTYNTSKFWSYIDWYKTEGDMAHDEDTSIDKQVTYQYELDSLDIAVGKHVKVTSSDTGGWKLFMKTATGYENVGTQNGTIKISTKLYDYSQDATGFAGPDTFDGNFFDQEPNNETRQILTALRDDLFTGELSVEYNTIFFTGLRKVLAEQLYVDWMFKTSFVNARNSVRQLDQRKTYTAGTDSWVESYINEVKPFHTTLREYKLGYTGNDTQDGIFSDFDNPPFYDSETSKIKPLNVATDTAKLTEYPWQMWNDYHKKHINSITLANGGSGYTKIPTVSIIGGTVNSTGPFQIKATSNSGGTSGSNGYFYPLFTSESQAKIWDSQNGGSGTAHTHTFDGYAGTFYMPTGSTNHAVTSKSGVYKLYEAPDTTAATATAKISDGKVTAITVTGIGANYTTTPTVIISGGADDGSSPSDQAKAYANLNNDLVRDINTTIKFDRISSTSTVVDWEASTGYAYGDLLRYNNALYKVTKAFTSTTDFDENENDVYKVFGDETGLTAADRTRGFYTPDAGMPGNELAQVMLGVDYGGTIVTGLLFGQSQGWDRSPWYDFDWDAYGTSKIKAFVADGSTSAFTISPAPDNTKVYQVYVTEDDSSRRKLDDVFRGDGSTTTFILSTLPNENALVEFIEFDDDGVLTPDDDRTLDSVIKGGLFSSALGTGPQDTILEGDDFVSPETSYAPEEVVPGQMFDTCDIKVYTSPESGVPFISDKNHRGDGTTTTFAIGDFPGTLGSVTVIVDNAVKKITTDYTISVANKTITFTTAPAVNAVISTKTFAISGENYRVLDQYTGDGSTVAFLTSTRGEFNVDSTASEIYVTIDGVPTTAFTTTTTANTITVTFSDAPEANSLVQIAGFNKSATSTRSYASIRTNTVTFDGSTARYTLTYPPGAIGPLSALTLIEVNGKVLRGPDHSYFIGDGSTYSYNATSGLGEDSTIDPQKTISSVDQIRLHVNGVEQIQGTDYSVDLSSQTVNTNTALTGTDVVCITTIVDNQYYNEGNDIILDLAQLTADGQTLTANDVLNVTTFNNALGTKIRREVLEGKASGVFNLRFDVLNSDYIFVWLNGEQLIQNADYTTSANIVTVKGKTISSTDRLDVMYFALDSAVGATGFRIFKDMLNRSHYKRISKTSTTSLVDDVTIGSATLQVKDGSVLPEPSIANNAPGVIFVDKERIEYFTKSGNTLGQLRRGTLGTGIKDHSDGAEVVDASGTQTIPYADTVSTDTFTGDGSTVVFAITNAPTYASELDIFIGGQRLLPTSEDGSTINYDCDGSTAAVTFTTAPASGYQIKILHKRGQVWYTAADGNPANGKGLQASTTAQAKFIADEPTNAPE